MEQSLNREQPCSTSLDSWPTSDLKKSKDHLNRAYSFSTDLPQDDPWHQAIAADPISIRHLTRYESCGTNAWIQENTQTGLYRLTMNTCKLRICPVCSRIAARRIKDTLAAALHEKTLKKWRLITLTIPTNGETLRASIKTLYASFKRLRKSENWRRYITGGYAVLEITFNPRSGHWHPHLHVVAGGLFYPWRELRDDWSVASNGATVTDIRAIKSTEKAVRYLTAYLGKCGNLDADTPLERRTEYYRTIQGQRFLITFGQAPRPKKIKNEKAQDDWRNVCPLWQYIIALRDGATWALACSKRLHRKELGDLEIADAHPPPLTAAAF